MDRDVKKPAYVPPDFIARPLDLENQINRAFAATFRPDNATAQLCLDYLTASFMNRIVGPNGSDADLRHREGQRDLVRIIKQRIDDGRNAKPALTNPSDGPRAAA